MTNKGDASELTKSDDLGNLPPHLRDRPKTARVLQKATPDDFVWLGDDGNRDPSAFANSFGSPDAILRAILLAIIDAHPKTSLPREQRVRAAMKASVDASPPGGSPKNTGFDHHLRRMALRHFLGVHGFEPPMRSFDALAKWALADDEDYQNHENEDSRSRMRRTLRERFEKEKDQLLDRLSADPWQMHETLAKVDRVLEALRDLGIATADVAIHDLFGETIGFPHDVRRSGVVKGGNSPT